MSKVEKTKYSANELKEFEDIINEKLGKARKELNYIKETLSRSNDSGTLAARQQKFINNLENALIRIKNGTYGICVDTGKLISKERLRAVPHTMHCIEAKLAQNK
jgi:RNA polymerase-binding transcription factor DksA